MYKMIIADDETLIREGLLHRNDWKAMGFEVVAVLEDGSDILNFLKGQRVDVLLTDICMYQMSGLEAANIIREKYPWMKIVLLSGYRKFEYAKEAMHCGIYEYLLKPVDYDQLREVFARIREELDAVWYEEQLLRSFGEEEYGQVLDLTRRVAGSVLGEGEETWMAYARLRPMMRDAPPQVREIIVRRLLAQLQGKLFQKDMAIAAEFEQRLRQLNFRVQSSAEISASLSELLCQLNDSLIDRNLISIPKRGTDDSISKACNWIQNHLGDDFTFTDVAEFVHLSPRHFRRRFQNEMGENFGDYVVRTRMEAAMRLLDEGRIMPEDVSQAVGYRDDKYFHQLFKKYTGYTVREYQRKKQEGI